MGFFGKKESVVQREPLPGYTDKEIVSLYNAGKAVTVHARESLVKEGDLSSFLYFVTSGSFRLFKNVDNRLKEVELLSRGEWLGDAAFSRERRSPFSAAAAETATVVAIDENGWKCLTPAVKAVVHQKMAESAVGKINQLAERLALSSDRNERLSAYFKKRLGAAKRGYGDSETITNILKNFPQLPLFANQLTTMLLNEKTSAAEIVQFARADPSIVSVVLKEINSDRFKFQRRISDFHQAVMLLGFNQVYQIVFDQCVLDFMPDTLEFKDIHFHSVMLSLICFELAALSNKQTPVLMSTLGLLHDIGKFITLLLKEKNPSMSFLINILDSDKIGALLLGSWNLTSVTVSTVEFHGYAEFCPPEELSPECRDSVAVLHIAHLCYDYMYSDKPTGQSGIFEREYMGILGLRDLSLPELVKKHIRPALVKKISSFPANIRNFLQGP